MASNFKFVTYNAPPQGKQQKKKASIPTSTSTVKRGQRTTSPMESLLTPGAGKSPFDMVASQPPEPEDPEVHFSQFKFGGSGPASPDDIPSIAELLEGLKATRTSSLDGEHVVTTEDNPDSSLGMHSVSQSGLRSDNPDGGGKSESDIPPILIEDSDRSDDDGDSDEMPMVSSGQSHSAGGLHDTMPATALSEPSQPSEAHSTAPGTTASSPSITTANTSPPQSTLDDSGCPTESAKNADLVEDDESHDDDEDLSDEDGDFAVQHHRGIARRGTRHHVQRTKRRRESSHDAISSGTREIYNKDGEPPRNAKRHKQSATDTSVGSVGSQHPARKYGLRQLPSRHQGSAALPLASARRTSPRRGSGATSYVRDTPRTDRVGISLNRPGALPACSPVPSRPAMQASVSSDCCHTCGISAQSILGEVSRTLGSFASDRELLDAVRDQNLSKSHRVVLAVRLCLDGIRGDITPCSIRPSTPTSRTDGRGFRSKYKSHALSVTDRRSSCDEMSDGVASSDITECDSGDEIDPKSTGGAFGEGNHHFKGKGRLWTKLENERLRTYRTEQKSWDWIARKLKRTKAAVQVHWSSIKLDY